MPNLNFYLGEAILKYKEAFQSNDISKNIIIAANPRGGSTWLEQILSTVNSTYTFYEPLNPSYSILINEMGNSSRIFLRREDENAKVKILFEKLLSGKSLTHRAIYHPNSSNNIKKIIFGKRIIFKFCRLNLLLPWLLQNFDDLKIIAIIRNPFAQISSQIEFASKYGGNWGSNKYLYDQFDFHLAFPEHADYLAKLNKKEEVLAAQWALNNKFLLESELSNKSWVNLSYELLLTNTELELERIAKRLSITFSNLKKNSVNKASKTTLSEIDLTKWRSKLTNTQVDNISNVLIELGLFKYYENKDMPSLNYYYGE